MSFWTKLTKPIVVLAPMADVTDAAFRRVIARHGKPDVTWTEFVSADGLYHTRELKKIPDDENPLMKDLLYTEAERPIVAQFFSSKPEMMEYAARLAAELGFDGIDINMGCPDRSIEKQCAGAALIKNPDLAIALVEAAKRGAGGLPVSVKTRIGYSKREELESWLPKILSAKPAALTLHARTRKEMSLVPARWEHVARAVEIRNEISPETLILGNGDVATAEEGRRLCQESGADGVMIGRGIFGNPWRFSKERNPDQVSLQEKLQALAEHASLFEELLSHKSFAIMKKHFKAYVAGFPGAAELRARLMASENAHAVKRVIRDYANPTE